MRQPFILNYFFFFFFLFTKNILALLYNNANSLQQIPLEKVIVHSKSKNFITKYIKKNKVIYYFLYS